MISYGDALKIARELGYSMRQFHNHTEQIPLVSSSGRVIARKLESPEYLPGFTNAAMDGYAVSTRFLKTRSGLDSIRMDIVGESSAGSPFPGRLSTDRPEACRIMTGAPLPHGADAVIKVEETGTDPQGLRVSVPTTVSAGQNCRYKGEDICKGDLLYSAGQKVTDTGILMMAALGIAQIPVFRRISVEIIPTGNEIICHSRIPDSGSGFIRNSTAPYLLSAIESLGCKAQLSTQVSDNKQLLFDMIQKAIYSSAKVIITTGGVSAGNYDYIPGIVRDLGGHIHFHKVAVRPGKPVLCASFNSAEGEPKILFGLPGNPVSTVVGFISFVQACLREATRQPPARSIRAELQRGYKSNSRFAHFLKGVLSVNNDGNLQVMPCLRQGSHQVGDFSDMNCWIFSPEGEEESTAGSDALVFPGCSGLPELRGDW